MLDKIELYACNDLFHHCRKTVMNLTLTQEDQQDIACDYAN